METVKELASPALYRKLKKIHNNEDVSILKRWDSITNLLTSTKVKHMTKILQEQNIMTLKQAIAEGKLEEFLKEHEMDAPADRSRLFKTLEAMEKPSPKETRSQDEETSP